MDKHKRNLALAGAACSLLSITVVTADGTVFFDDCQVYTQVASEVTSDTISSNGYLFTYTRDKLFTGGTGQPIGRPVRVAWPDGVEAQAVTTPPPGVTDYKARIRLERVDGQVFDLTAFTAKLLANTYGAGGAIEIMPLVNGEDAFDEPLFFDVTGFYGQVFSYDTSPNPWGSTALLTGFDTYKVALYVDFAFIGLTLDSPAAGPRSCCLPDDTCSDLTANECVVQGGSPQGAGTSCPCNPCAVSGAPPPVPDGRLGTTPMRASRLTVAGDSIQLSWDATSCPASDTQLLYGELSLLASYALGGAVCSLGPSGTFVWTGVPVQDLYFLVVATDGAETEGSWGVDSAGQERNASAPSGFCGVTIKDATGTCP